MPSATLYSIPGFADPFSSLSHLLGAAVCAVFAVPLIRKGLSARHDDGRRPGVGHITSLVIFAASAVLLLTMSGVYHMLGPGGGARAVFQRLDHAAIFILIAGTFTPIHAILFRGLWRWGMLVFVWTLAVTGVTLKSIYFASMGMTLGVGLYIGMGWIGAASIFLLVRRYGLRMALPVALGGLAYTAGAALDWAEPSAIIPGVVRGHEIFHIAVLIGLALHWLFVWRTAGLRTTAVRP